MEALLIVAGVICLIWFIAIIKSDNKIDRPESNEKLHPKISIDDDENEVTLSFSFSENAPEFGELSIAPDGIVFSDDDIDPEDVSDNWLPVKLVDNASVRAGIVYKDARGRISVRVVDIDGLYGPSVERIQYFTAWCHLKEDRRSFRVDRIVRICDPVDGGQLVEADNFFDWVTKRTAA
jgi:hypothetical protein